MSYQNPTPDEAAQERKLPAWAQTRINALRSGAEYSRSMWAEYERKVEALEAWIAEAAATRNEMTRRATAAGYRFTGGYGRDSETTVVTTVETLGAMLDRIEALTAAVKALEEDIADFRGQP